MPTHATDTENQTLGGAVKEVAEHASALARLEIELASLELKKKVTAIGVGLGPEFGAPGAAAGPGNRKGTDARESGSAAVRSGGL
jgi:phage-related tail protein